MASPILTDNFESYSTGNLNGQGSWSGNATFQVENTVKNSGNQAVSATTSGSTLTIDKIGTAQNNGEQVFYFRASQTNALGQVIARNSALDVALEVAFEADGHIYDYSDSGGSTVTDLGTYSSGQFYKVLIEWRNSDHAHRVTINNGTPTTWLNPINTNPENADRIRLDCRNTGTFYFDDFQGNLTNYVLTCTTGTYNLTGNTISFLLGHAYTLICTTGQYVLTGFNAIFTKSGWVFGTKHTTAVTNAVKHVSSWVFKNKN